MSQYPVYANLYVGNLPTMFPNYLVSMGSTSAQALDQNTVGGASTAAGTNQKWQSFVCGTTGFLTQIAFNFQSNSAVAYTMTLYAGVNSIGGTLLTTQTLTFPTGSGLQVVSLSTPIALTSGNGYTLAIVKTDASNFSLQFGTGTPYAGGGNNVSTANAYQLETFITAAQQYHSLDNSGNAIFNENMTINGTTTTRVISATGSITASTSLNSATLATTGNATIGGTTLTVGTTVGNPSIVVGTGSAGQSLGYCSTAGTYFTGTAVGDIALRGPTSGTLHVGVNGAGTAQLQLSSANGAVVNNNLTAVGIVAAATMTSTGVANNFGTTGSSPYISIGPLAGGNEPLFGYSSAASTFFTVSAATGDGNLRVSNTANRLNLGVGNTTAQIQITNTAVNVNVPLAVAITGSTINQGLQITNAANNPYLQLGDGAARAGPLFGYSTGTGNYFINATAGDGNLLQPNTADNLNLGVGAANEAQIQINGALNQVLLGTWPLNPGINSLSGTTGAITFVAKSWIFLNTAVATYTLPTLTSANNGNELYMIKISSATNTVTLSAAAGQTINGASTSLLTTQYTFVILVAFNNGWFQKS
jgi:hypothetical protein